MTSLERFQNQHGQSWGQLTGTPAYVAALSLLNVEKLEAIAALTDDEILVKGQVILADLRGHLAHENALFGLHELKKFVFQDLGQEEYPDPSTEAVEESDFEKGEAREFGRPTFIQTPVESQIPPKPKRKYRKRRRRKLGSGLLSK